MLFLILHQYFVFTGNFWRGGGGRGRRKEGRLGRGLVEGGRGRERMLTMGREVEKNRVNNNIGIITTLRVLE